MSKNTAKDTQPTNYELLTAIQNFANFAEEHFATKDDLLNFATKDDLAVVRQDLNGVKLDLSSVKQDLQIVQQTVSNQQDILIFHTSLLENIATNVNKIQMDHIAAIDWLKRHENKLEIHESDINNLKFQLNGI